MKTRRCFVALALVSLVACTRTHSSHRTAQVSSGVPSAVITDDFAQFVFPSQRDERWEKPTPGERWAGETDLYFWSVEWVPQRLGIDPQQVSVSLRWRTISPPNGPLASIVAGAAIEVMSYCVTCGTGAPVLTVLNDPKFRSPALSAEMRDGSVVLTIRGRPAVKSVFSTRPDSVDLYIRRPSDQQSTSVALKVRTSLPRAK